MKYKILIISITLLLLTVGFATAKSLDDLKMPNDYKSTGSSGMFNKVGDNGVKGTGVNAAITKYNDADFKDYTTNDSSDGYIVLEKEGKYWYTSNDEAGIVEVVTVDSDKFLVVFWVSDPYDSSLLSDAYNDMLSFNSLNSAVTV